MVPVLIKLSAILLIVTMCSGDVSELVGQPLSDVCLGCICQAISGCRQETVCEGDHCGLFHITSAYWSDAGTPTINGLAPDHPDAFQSCVLDPYCAAQTVQGYMRKFGQDCNGDGVTNCFDYMMINHHGGGACHAPLQLERLGRRRLALFSQCRF
ncbi:lysozyme-like isoform X1 [Choristoneura fumiferana]|uniref:lysozyme-like isoform X1 n=1 Tax=Choristoneura fumiferana TaxID=7141 RepID=UPI003D15CA74